MEAVTDYAAPRDRFGRPLLYPPAGGPRIAYTRASTAAKWTDDKGGLINWAASQAMIGLMKSRPLQARVSSIIASTREDSYRENKVALKEIVDSATAVAQAAGRADYGTAMHTFTEMVDSGNLDWQYVPENLKGPLDAYREAMQAITVLDSEVFVAVDEQVNGKWLHIAGSMDRVVSHPEFGVVAADLKTGADEPRYGLGVTAQVAIYARGKRYRDDVFPGTPKFDDGEPNGDGTAHRKELWPGVSHTAGLMIHCPLEPVNGKYICDFYLLDLEKGWRSLELGHTIQMSRRGQRLKKL